MEKHSCRDALSGRMSKGHPGSPVEAGETPWDTADGPHGGGLGDGETCTGASEQRAGLLAARM